MGLITYETVALVQAQNGLVIETYGSRLELVMGVMSSGAIGGSPGDYGGEAHIEALNRIEEHLAEVRKKIAEEGKRERLLQEGWEKWWLELQSLVTEANWPIGDKENWEEYWVEGYTPKQALDEDISYGQD